MRVILRTKPRKKPFIPIEAEAIIPQNFLRKNDIHVYEGNKERNLEELFYITTEGPAVSPDQVEIVLSGETGIIKRVGEYMNAGRIIVEGDIGMHCGNFMSAGEIIIKGNAGAWLGREMRGGIIHCEGNAGHYCAAGYRGEKRGVRGGLVEVMGNAGDFTAEYLSGGEIRVKGDCGDLRCDICRCISPVPESCQVDLFCRHTAPQHRFTEHSAGREGDHVTRRGEGLAVEIDQHLLDIPG